MGDAQQRAGCLGGHRPHHHLLHLLLLLHPVTLAVVGGCMRVVQTCRHLLSQAFLSQKQLVAFFLDVTPQLLKPTYLDTKRMKKCSM